MMFTALVAISCVCQLTAEASSALLKEGVEALRNGRVEASVTALDQFAQSAPESMPYLWQRGIAQYFAGQFREGRKQFEAHRTVNPNDVENAAWHFLCVAATDGVAEARRAMLPAPGDPRVPMAEIYALYAGTGDIASVDAAVQALPPRSPARRRARFYADLYIGLLAHAKGDAVQAERYIDAAGEFSQPSIMADVARVAHNRLVHKKDPGPAR